MITADRLVCWKIKWKTLPEGSRKAKVDWNIKRKNWVVDYRSRRVFLGNIESQGVEKKKNK